MAVVEHLSQSDVDRPGKAGCHNGSSMQFVLNAVGEAGPVTHIFKLMPVNPAFKRTGYLLVDEQLIVNVLPVERHPLHGPNLQNDARACRDAAGLAQYPGRWKFRSEQLQSIITLMEAENPSNRSVYNDAFYELRHIQ